MLDVPAAFGNRRPQGEWIGEPLLWVPAMIATTDHPDYDLCLNLTVEAGTVSWSNGFKAFDLPLTGPPTVEGDTIILPTDGGEATVRPLEEADLANLAVAPERKAGEALHDFAIRAAWGQPPV